MPSIRFIRFLLIFSLLSACTSTVSAQAPEPLKVLVTGFNDWVGVDATSFERCEQNPSCRLILSGLLADELADSNEEIEWTFKVLPVTWTTDEYSLWSAEYDVIIHLGVNATQDSGVLMLEDGAYNAAYGKDVLGNVANGVIENDADIVREAPKNVHNRIISLDGEQLTTHIVNVAPARSGNSYICNRINYRALMELEQSSRVSAVYFIHIPLVSDEALSALAKDVTRLIGLLIV